MGREHWVWAIVLLGACTGDDGIGSSGGDAGHGADARAADDARMPGGDAGPDTVRDADEPTDAFVPTPFEPPYDLPSSGEVVRIPIEGRNVAVDVKPAAHGNGSWQYSLFQSYGGGVFAADYSDAGAYVIAGTGGHRAPACFGAAIFDFTTGTWSYLPNGNGFDEARAEDVERTTETNGSPYLELTAVTTPGMPSPAHTYQLMIAPPRSVLGGARGSVIRTVGAAQTFEAWDSPQSHVLDLETGVWSRASTNLLRDVFDWTPYTDAVAAYDRVDNRIYLLLGDLASYWRLPYLDLADGAWKNAGSYDSPTATGHVRTMFVDEERRLLVVVRSTAELWAFDLNDVERGPVRLAVDGTVPTRAMRWHRYPIEDGGDGSWYAFTGVGPVYDSVPPYPLATDQFLNRLTPPAGDPLTEPWTFSTVPIDGGLTAQYVQDPGSGAFHHTRFFYVPSIRSFAWIPNGTGAVELVRP